jgi:hypothetical protein
MSETVFKNAKVYLDGFDISGQTNSVTLNQGVDLLDRTALSHTSRRRKPGLKDVSVSLSGFWDSTNTDKEMFSDIGTTGVVSIMPTSNAGAINSLSFFTANINGEYSPSGSIGDLYGFTFAGNGQGELARGLVFKNAALSTASPSTILNLGVVKSGIKDHFAIHVINDGTSTGANINIEVAASTDVLFGGSPSTLFSVNVTSANVGNAIYTSTNTPSTAHLYYRATVIQNSSQGRKLFCVASIGRNN